MKPPSQITVAAIGRYPYPFEAELQRALKESVEAHCKAYGLRDVQVSLESAPVEGYQS